jgi:hypothetical protein
MPADASVADERSVREWERPGVTGFLWFGECAAERPARRSVQVDPHAFVAACFELCRRGAMLVACKCTRDDMTATRKALDPTRDASVDAAVDVRQGSGSAP